MPFRAASRQGALLHPEIAQFIRFRLKKYATMSLNSVASSITFGMVGCGVSNAADSAVPVIPGTFAMVSKRGAAAFGESVWVLSIAWHSEQIFRAKAKPAPA